MPTKISRRVYHRISQDELATFAHNIINRIHGVPAFDFLQDEVQALALPLEQYIDRLHAALNRGRIEIAAKNLARKTLLAALDTVAAALEYKAPDNAALILEAGFSASNPVASRRNGMLPLQAPVALRVVSTGNKGELRIQLSNETPNRVLSHAIEYSVDQGTHWQNGNCHTRSNFVLRDLPACFDLQLRFRALGSGDNKSPWSKPVSAGVL